MFRVSVPRRARFSRAPNVPAGFRQDVEISLIIPGEESPGAAEDARRRRFTAAPFDENHADLQLRLAAATAEVSPKPWAPSKPSAATTVATWERLQAHEKHGELLAALEQNHRRLTAEAPDTVSGTPPSPATPAYTLKVATPGTGTPPPARDRAVALGTAPPKPKLGSVGAVATATVAATARAVDSIEVVVQATSPRSASRDRGTRALRQKPPVEVVRAVAEFEPLGYTAAERTALGVGAQTLLMPELDLGDIVDVMDADGEWLAGRNRRTDASGWFPARHVKAVVARTVYLQNSKKVEKAAKAKRQEW
jgi:hypothetical protein